MAVSYESEDETMGKLHARSRRGTALYSKQDILEQYCISERGLGALETDRRSFFSCLSSHQMSPCTRSSILTVCVRQKVPSDENLQDLYKRPAAYVPYPRKPRWGPPPPEIYNYDEDLNSSYFRRKGHTDASTYQWMPSDDESVRMERPRSILDHHSHQSGLPTTPHRTKHVSFARSHTLTSFDDAVVSLGASASNLSKSARSQERLIDTRRSLDRIIPITKQPEFAENVVVMEKLIRTPMKTQATQTEACLGRKPLPSSQINLSPRTVHRVKMVSQGAQTNGMVINGRKLTKSFSEAGSKFEVAEPMDHEPLQRTLSDEPPRSPFVLASPPPDLVPPLPALSDSSSITRSEHDSEESESKKEIFIDFKPQISVGKKVLTKTASDGEILLDQRKIQGAAEVPQTSISHDNILAVEDDSNIEYASYFKSTPIRHEGIFKDLDDHVFSSIDESYEGNGGLYPQDSIDEVFHENYIYDGKYLKVEGSTTTSEDQEVRKSEEAPEDEGVVPSFYIDKSPFASSDSLANDLRSVVPIVHTTPIKMPPPSPGTPINLHETNDKNNNNNNHDLLDPCKLHPTT
ncbi:PREDICTED: uncharacterized protein LOC108564538 [Nicrophorus vespilloides]|uniref:Uncharacterized protein LOC108564538 n=1 Tax=Nicrophorus vespilloides TaxID=110193 RepID=A0ABM1MX01_NICVS|nr:PREDICTED: uncharacterized protein LOC108564538 [Nicrophorus vespilloides]